MQPSAPTQVWSLPLCLSAALLPCQLSAQPPPPPPQRKPTHVLTCVTPSGCLTPEGMLGQHNGEKRPIWCIKNVSVHQIFTVGWWACGDFCLWGSSLIFSFIWWLNISVFPLSWFSSAHVSFIHRSVFEPIFWRIRQTHVLWSQMPHFLFVKLKKNPRVYCWESPPIPVNRPVTLSRHLHTL